MSLLSDDTGSSPRKLMTKPPHRWTSQRTPVFGDRGMVAVGNGDPSVTLTALLTVRNSSPRALATGCCCAIVASVWAPIVVVVGGGPWAITRAGGALVPSIGRYEAITLTLPVVFRVIDWFTLTGITYFDGGSSKVDKGVGAKTKSVR
uniref:Uncharacterized protein n=1 Tax=Romanomermis culicivorax TaxID=13658 RepID=A0A915IVX3_ROMCU